MPHKLTAMHHWHLGRGGAMIDRIGWQQVDHYQAPAEEVRLVRAGVGAMDDSPLGKIDLVGVDLEPALTQFAPRGLPARLSSGRLSISGGNVAATLEPKLLRLAEDHAWIVTDPASGDAVAQVISEQTAAFDCVHPTDITSVYAVVRVAGPRSRGLLADLSPVDLRDTKFSNGSVAQAGLANVRTIIHRADVGDLLAYELYFARDCGEYLWEALLTAGREWDVIPFGLSAWSLLGEGS